MLKSGPHLQKDFHGLDKKNTLKQRDQNYNLVLYFFILFYFLLNFHFQHDYNLLILMTSNTGAHG